MLAPRDDVYAERALCGHLRLRTRDLGPGLMAKVRYRKPLAEVARTERRGRILVVSFREPQWAVTPGQSLVLYRDGVVVGGGIIEEGT